MGKAWGRSKRREARALIAELEQRLERARSDYHAEVDRAINAERSLRRITQAVEDIERHSAALPIKVSQGNTDAPEIRNDKLQFPRHFSPDERSVPVLERVMHRLRVSAETRGALQNCLAVRIVHNRIKIESTTMLDYYCSERVVDLPGFRAQLAQDIARALVDKLGKIFEESGIPQ